MISPTQLRFEIGFPEHPCPIVDVWHVLIEYLQKKKCLPKTFKLSQIVGHPERLYSTKRLICSAEEVACLIAQRQLSGFQVSSGNYPYDASFSLTHGKELGTQSVLMFRSDIKANVPFEWRFLIERLMILFPAHGGWQWNCLYGAWQGALELHTSFIETFGEVPANAQSTTKKSIDGIGPDRIMLDISEYPGRSRELLPTIYFHPTAEMWLGPHFWQYAKCTKEEALAADFFIEKRDTPHFLYLKCWPEPFTRPDGEQGRMQQRLWKLFFHEDCEWPPSSGTICDEPMYGPPELMPGYKAGTDG